MPLAPIFEGQLRHWLALVLLLTMAWRLGHPPTSSPGWLGCGAPCWFLFALGVPVLHQVYVWAVWRIELHTRAFSRLMGRHAFAVYAADFLILLVARVAVLLALAAADRDTLGLAPATRTTLIALMLVPFLYTLYSVAAYFGFTRAMGKDHFDPDLARRGVVRRGVFRYVSNAMYTFAFLGLWMIAIGYDSRSALVAATFQHAYIWVHYFCTERPDMRRLYGV